MPVPLCFVSILFTTCGKNDSCYGDQMCGYECHFGFHYILNEFGHFYLLKLFNPLVNGDWLLRTMTCFTST
jgi:hypothetical protein